MLCLLCCPAGEDDIDTTNVANYSLPRAMSEKYRCDYFRHVSTLAPHPFLIVRVSSIKVVVTNLTSSVTTTSKA